MIGGFLRYSLKTGKKIAVVFLGKDGIARKNVTVRALDEEARRFTAALPGRKKEETFSFDDVLTCDYARGDRGDLEE